MENEKDLQAVLNSAPLPAVTMLTMLIVFSKSMETLLGIREWIREVLYENPQDEN